MISSRPLSVAERLKFSELRYRRLFETAQDGILILDEKSGKIIDANPFLMDLLEYSENELLGKQLWQIGVFKDIVDSKKAFRQLQTSGYIRYKDLPLQTKNGKSIDVEFVSNVYQVGPDSVIQCNIRDITDRKQFEEVATKRTHDLEKLTETQEKTKRALLNVMEDLDASRSLLEIAKAKDEATLASIGEGLFVVDNEGRLTNANKVLEKMLGLKTKDYLGKDVTKIHLVDEDGKAIPFEKRPTTLALASNKIVKVMYYYLRKNNTKFPISITATPVKLNGKTIGLVEMVRDVTSERAIDKAKTEFVSLASHQLRTPLGIVKWYIEALENKSYVTSAPKEIQDYFEQIKKSNERVLGLVRDLLSVSRIEQGKSEGAPRIVNIVHLLKEIVEQVGIMARENKVSIKVNICCKKMPMAFLDPLKFREVVENLLTNAINYSKINGHVVVSVNRNDSKFLISVKDNGIGISEFDKKMLFTKFFRSEKAIKSNPEGSGLGLYVVKSYVEQWGGRVSVQSVYEKGSSFTITIPIKKQSNNYVNIKGGEIYA